MTKKRPSIARVDTRQLDEADLDAVLDVQRDCYRPGLVESRGSFARKLALFPPGCLGSFDGRELVGYCFSFPWRVGDIFPIDTCVENLPPDPDCLYIHDIAVVPSRRRENVARGLLLRCINLARARGLPSLAGVAVQGSEHVWRRFGFVTSQRVAYAPGEDGIRIVLNLEA
ncbi:MAG: GNAT family N-acetyltransferase [Candidatus Lokiarchaeota archaeon]|nr:GNAT family N-acetyltransferase [Candidatus Lokiarchaeota archaeon]